MPDHAETDGRSDEVVPLAVLDATRAALRIETAADARRCAESLVRGLGGALASRDAEGVDVIPMDVSFGQDEPVLVVAPADTRARALLERHLTVFLQDARYVLELKNRTVRLADAASTDVLTGLPNRRVIDRALGRLGGNDTVMIIDLDHFKRVNDEHGHAAGDEVLRAFGAVLRGAVLGRDFVGRFGGEEFVAVLGPPVAGVDVFLLRLRSDWWAARPYPVTFSVGVARSVGNPDETVRLADEALYRAKKAGRDQACWATESHKAGEPVPRDYVRTYLREAVAGKRRPAVALAIDLLDQRVRREDIVEDLLAAAQREVGERWQRNELTAADEHIATGVAAAALDALMGDAPVPVGAGLTVVTCAEGDWHSLAAQMFGESLRSQGMGVSVLGASTPIDVVVEFLARSGGDSLAVSCSLPIFFPGVARLADAAHEHGIPVIVGGRAFGADGCRAARLGADAWAPDASGAAVILRAWLAERPALHPWPVALPGAGVRLAAAAGELAGVAFAALPGRFAPMVDYDERQLKHTHRDLVFMVRFLAAAVLVDDPAVFTDFLRWLCELLRNRGVPDTAVLAALDLLGPLVAGSAPEASTILEQGRQLLLSG